MLAAFCDCCSNMALMPVLKFNMIIKLNCITEGLCSLSILIWLKCFSSVAFRNRFIPKPGSRATSSWACPRSEENPKRFPTCVLHYFMCRHCPKLQTWVCLVLAELLAEESSWYRSDVEPLPASPGRMFRFRCLHALRDEERRFGARCLAPGLLSNGVTASSGWHRCI